MYFSKQQLKSCCAVLAVCGCYSQYFFFIFVSVFLRNVSNAKRRQQPWSLEQETHTAGKTDTDTDTLLTDYPPVSHSVCCCVVVLLCCAHADWECIIVALSCGVVRCCQGAHSLKLFQTHDADIDILTVINIIMCCCVSVVKHCPHFEL